MRLFASRSFVGVLGFCFIVAVAEGATWTGMAAPDNNWTTPGNWDTGVPGVGELARFTGPGNGNTAISLGGATRSIGTLEFDTASAAAYTIGQLPGDALSFSGGEIWAFGEVTNPQTINATVLVDGSLLATNIVPNGVTTGSGLVGLTFGPVQVGGTFFVSNVGTSVTTVLDGSITDSAGQPGMLHLLATTGGGTNNTNFVINGNNTYTGGTIIQANTGTNGAVYLGSDSPFGTGKVNTLLQNNSVEFRALGGTRTISNAIDLNGGINFAGEHSFVLTGPIAVIASGASRTFQNKITAPGATVSLGAAPGSSAIYLGNPVANGGDGIGKTLILGPQAGATFVFNAVAQDPADPNLLGNTARGTLHFGGLAGGTTVVNSRSTYTGPTLLGNGANSTVQFSHDYNAGDPSGPFGLGTLTTNNNGTLQPVGGDRTLANPLHISANAVNSHFTVSNAADDTSGLTLTGPITMSAAGRSIRNNFAADGGILTLGSDANPSTFTLATAAGQTLRIEGTGRTVINHTIQDSPGIATDIDVRDNSIVTINGPQNTDGNLTVRTNATVVMNGNRTGAGTITLTGAVPKLFVHGTKTGGGAITIGSTSTLGGTGTLDGEVINNFTIAPGTLEGVPGTLTLTGDVTNNADSRWLIGLNGTTAGKLVIGGNLDLSAVDSLDVLGAGSGSSWVIATYGGTLTGTFDNVSAGYAVDYGTGVNSQITLMAVAVGLAGDFNSDGKVDAADYVLWRKNEGSSNALPNDNNLGTPIGQAHYDLWRASFGSMAGGGSALSAAGVPEPTTILLLLLAVAGCAGIGARSRAC